ncbi:MAG: Cof-type HAD-IIB family hydrolase [Thomasclavelia sp.]|nr:Cof-type HAD-IIB family hydrolase [Thomasclavelia sp.]
MIKAIFFDIDGTLITHEDQKMPSSTLKSLQLLKEKGIKLFVCTGRPYHYMKFIREMFEFDGYVCCNGQHVVDHNFKTLSKSFINQEDINALVEYVDNGKIKCDIALEDQVYRNYNNDYKGMKGTYSLSLKECLNKKAYQAMVYVSDDYPLLDVMPHCKSQRWTPDFMDVVPQDGGKDRGIDKVIEILGITLDQTMAFGDGLNDILMLRHAGLSVAMGVSDKEVKNVASYVTTDIKDDGIYNALKHFKIL